MFGNHVDLDGNVIAAVIKCSWMFPSDLWSR
jgi:hypothetical protein